MQKSITALICLLSVLMLVPSVGSQPRVFQKGALVGKAIAVSYPHHELHKCLSFTSVINNSSLASGAKLQLLLNTPASTPNNAKNIHMVIIARCSSEGRYEIWKNPTVTDIGTAMREENRNQRCTNSAGMEVTHTPTITNAGEHLGGFDMHFGSGQVAGGEARGLTEINLDNNTLYLINGVSESANNDFTIEPDWYEDVGDAP